ncbi:unnamed protein product [[Candida] boidinii]|nr:unnamed protein product [[Candida] boidinii]
MSDKINRNTTATSGNSDTRNNSGGRNGIESSYSTENINTNNPSQPNSNNNNNNNSSLMKINPICTVIVTKFFNSDNNSRLLNLVVDDIVHVLSKSTTGWWDGITIDPNGSKIKISSAFTNRGTNGCFYFK